MKKLLLMLSVLSLVPVFESQAGLGDFLADVAVAPAVAADAAVDVTTDGYYRDRYDRWDRPYYRSRYRDDWDRPYYGRRYRNRGWWW